MLRCNGQVFPFKKKSGVRPLERTPQTIGQLDLETLTA